MRTKGQKACKGNEPNLKTDKKMVVSMVKLIIGQKHMKDKFKQLALLNANLMSVGRLPDPSVV